MRSMVAWGGWVAGWRWRGVDGCGVRRRRQRLGRGSPLRNERPSYENPGTVLYSIDTSEELKPPRLKARASAVRDSRGNFNRGIELSSFLIHESSGTPIDATFELELLGGHFSLIVQSRSGRGRRNSNYDRGLELILERLGALGATLVDAYVDSRNTQSMTVGERRLNVSDLGYPVQLGEVTDFGKLRMDLARAQASIGASEESNRNKRIRLQLDVPEFAPISDMIQHLGVAVSKSEWSGDEDETTEEQTSVAPTYRVADIIAEGCFIPKETLLSYLDAAERKKNLILQGPPGTGKTWLAKRLARVLIGSDPAELLQSVQFHPSLSYEDFVRGWRPGDGGTLALVDGLFLEIVRKAEGAPGSKHVLVIEEINRGNLAQIFGELLTLLEADKRDPAEALTLAYRKAGDEPVFLPPNLYIIGTMNLADRSLAIVDFALRRRFAFADLSPRFNDAWRTWVASRNALEPVFLGALASRVEVLNQRIAADTSLGDQYCIGHSFFTPPTDTPITDPHAWIRAIVDQEIRPLLSEYWFDDPQKVIAETNALIGSP
jgi:hypothetical protein